MVVIDAYVELKGQDLRAATAVRFRSDGTAAKTGWPNAK
jgi:hypothetical protein